MGSFLIAEHHNILMQLFYHVFYIVNNKFCVLNKKSWNCFMDLNCHLLSSFWRENPKYKSYEVDSDNCKHLEDRILLVVWCVHDCMFVYHCEINGIQHIILHAI